MRILMRSHDASGSARWLDVRPDDADARDFLYHPTLQPLPSRIDHRRRVPKILDQGEDGACVGYALAAVINLSTASRRVGGGRRPAAAATVSARMLYEMGQRFDEWQGQAYVGTSLRGGMKAWNRLGATSERRWPNHSADREWTPARAEDAMRRPLGAYYRIHDGNPAELQAAIVEADAVLVSLWVHPGWRADQLLPPRRGDTIRLRRIDSRAGGAGLHAVAVVGYTADGLIVQNSWGRTWGSGGFALLSWDDWCANRQDAWVGRPAPATHDRRGRPMLYAGAFAGARQAGRAGTTAEGLDIDPAALPYLVNTGDRGGLDGTHRLKTRAADLPAMAARVRAQPTVAGRRHVMLYAHGGLDSETEAVAAAGTLYGRCHDARLTAYFFVWETGTFETVLGLLRSRDDAKGPAPAALALPDVLRTMKGTAAKLARDAQYAIGRAMSGGVRLAWDEMLGRAAGASTAEGGARLFLDALLEAMRTDPDRTPYVLHLVAHSAGSIYLAHAYDQVLRAALEDDPTGRVQLGSIHLMAPALTIDNADRWLAADGALPVARDRYRVYMLTPRDEQTDGIFIYPSSLLTYVADCLDSPVARVPLLGIRTDFDAHYAGGAGPTPVTAMATTHTHVQFDDPGHEIDRIIAAIAAGTYS